MEEKLGEIVGKKLVKKVGSKEVVQCSNEICFLGLDVNVALAGRPRAT